MRQRLYFHEAKYAFVPTDDVDFAVVLCRAEILGNDAITEAAKVKVSLHFAAARGLEMSGLRLAEILRGRSQGASEQSNEPKHEVLRGRQ